MVSAPVICLDCHDFVPWIASTKFWGSWRRFPELARFGGVGFVYRVGVLFFGTGLFCFRLATDLVFPLF